MNAVTEINTGFTNFTQSLKQDPGRIKRIPPEEHGRSGSEVNNSRYSSGSSGCGCQNCVCAGGGR